MPLLNSKSRTGNASIRSETETNKKIQRNPRSYDRRQDYSDSEDDRSKSSAPVRKRMATPPWTPPRHERFGARDERERSRDSSARYLLTPPSTAPKAKPSRARYQLTTSTTLDASDSEEEEEYIPSRYRAPLLNPAHSLPSPRITPPPELETQVSSSTSRPKCGGRTKAGTACKNPGQAKHGGGCHFHPRESTGITLRSEPMQSPESIGRPKCGGRTKAGTACKNPGQAKHGGGCHFHPRQSDNVSPGSDSTQLLERISKSICGGTTKAGTACRNPGQAKHGGGCHFHPRIPRGVSLLSDQIAPRPVEERLSGSKPRCAATTKSTGRRCKKNVTALGKSYCSAHKAQEIPRPIVRGDSSPIKLKFSDWIPTHLQPGTREELRKQLQKPLSKNDQAGYIYAFERRDRQRKSSQSTPQDFVIKVGRSTKSVASRQKEWERCFEPKELVVHGWWPNNLGDAGSDSTRSRSSHFEAYREDGMDKTKGKYCYRVERLVLLELEDVARNSVHLQPKFLRKVTKGIAKGRMGSSVKRPSPAPEPLEEICRNCRSKSGNGVRHQEIFKLKRLADHEMAGKEWEFVVRPIIEKWGRFMAEFGDKLDLILWEDI